MQITLCDCCGEQIIDKAKTLTNRLPFAVWRDLEDMWSAVLCPNCYEKIIDIATKAKREYECPTQD